MYENASAESLVGKSFDIEHRINEVLLMTGLAEVADRAVGAATPLTEDVALADALRAAQPSLMLRNLAQLRHGATFGLHPAARADSARGISAAQLRCLTIATELVNRPGLLFLEDPFADLQWQDAEQVGFSLMSMEESGELIRR
jgi:ABC-type branched-subunit amino acid transport system ATPase component